MTGIARLISFSFLITTALAFAGCQAQEGGATSTTTTSAKADGPKIVFVRLDSLQAGYTDLATELERLQENVQAADDNIQKQMASLQSEMQRIQNKIQRGEMTPKMIQNEQQRLGGKEQEIMQQRDLALASIQEDQMRLQQQFGERVKEILEELQEEKGYDYILNEGGGGGVLVARDSYDITAEVLTRLNATDGGMAKDSIQ
ncbi:OmpH family outer membrane protein [Neolewinella aurantiaca]|uniref:OmpH family outer membrane protein n=1 Tax=Neolewinella aurantiaca TaxID=2602767 RepID=A0A5C7FN06_9BACT|nr:OmpH family outer membrane protein [Neolewinella aurantiaca]TXF91524.1 OmpH family outer membrane protein [Neolewinella aurantiaca]